MELNKPLIEKMITRFEEVPESYTQQVICTHDRDKLETPRPVPECGTFACLAGQAVVCSEPTVKLGIAKLDALLSETNGGYLVTQTAAELMGLSEYGRVSLFHNTSGSGWPEPFNERFEDAATYKGEARVAINLLKAILRTDGKILES